MTPFSLYGRFFDVPDAPTALSAFAPVMRMRHFEADNRDVDLLSEIFDLAIPVFSVVCDSGDSFKVRRALASPTPKALMKLHPY